MACSPGSDPPERVTDVRNTTWVGVPPDGVDLHIERSVVPGDHRPGQLRRQGQPRCHGRPPRDLVLGSRVQAAEVCLERRRLQGERPGRLGEGHRGVDQVHGAHRAPRSAGG